MHKFTVVGLGPPGSLDPSIAIAASRAGGLGVLDVTLAEEADAAGRAIQLMASHAHRTSGVRLDAQSPIGPALVGSLPVGVRTVILAGDWTTAGTLMGELKASGRKVFLEVIGCLHDLPDAADGFVAKGNESGGVVGEETTFVAIQRLVAETELPVLAHGGIGLNTAAAVRAAGAAGVVLDAQLLLVRESPLTEPVRTVIRRMDGTETACLGAGLGRLVRCYRGPAAAAAARLGAQADQLLRREDGAAARAEWRRSIRASLGWGPLDQTAWPIGQDGAFARPLAESYVTTGRVIQAIVRAANDGVAGARRRRIMAPSAPLAKAHGTRYPIVQGPMTRVSDSPAFAAEVAARGALPFLSLALSPGPDVTALLRLTRERLGDRPWGVGILGFLPRDLREEQLAAIRACRPPFALIAGGRPAQARGLEEAGITTYIHVPSPALLERFLQDGARRFVFEGRECGGHVGPRSSFVLWESMLDTLQRSLEAPDFAATHILFAGGVHDGRSAAMVAALAEPLAQRGARIGVLVGTAYLFTREIADTGAVVAEFQAQALRCQQTTLLETGPGHATRCADTSFTATFATQRQRLIDGGADGDTVREELERLNLGRLRLAAKGVWRRGPQNSNDAPPPLVEAPVEEQQHHGMYMLGQVAALRERQCSLEQLHRTISEGSCEQLGRAVPSPARRGRRRGSPYDVAIVGIACRLPGAPSLSRYWENILAGVDAITEVPPERWSIDRYYDPDPTARDKVYSRWGGFIEELAFDPVAYGLPPASIPSIEPLQLLALVVAHDALADAGLLDRAELRERTSVILGVGGGIGDLGHRYAVRTGLPAVIGEVPANALDSLPEWTEDSFPGVLPNVTAGRIANRLDLGGVNYIVDAACASSLAAVQLGCRELEADTSDAVLVGGAESAQNIFGYMCFAKTRALSPRGRCRPFDADADGIAISEGVAMLVLRRLEDAQRDGDRIYAAIRGIGGSSDGRHRALTAPRPEGQTLALRRAYDKAGCSAASVGLVEAHGTGTVAGDRAELETLNRALVSAGARTRSCVVGSVKSMIGHTKSTAGVAGLVKATLALHHKVLPPTLHVERPNPALARADTPLYVNTEARAWVHDSTQAPRRAAVSAFGFGGTNFHAVLEEVIDGAGAPSAPRSEWPSELFVWGGSTGEVLADVKRLSAALDRGVRPRLRDLALTLWRRVEAEPEARLAIVAGSLEELAGSLNEASSMLPRQVDRSGPPARIWAGTERPTGPTGVAALFPGQGSQYCDMLRELTLQFGELRERFESADAVLADRYEVPLSSLVFPPRAFEAATRESQERALRATEVAQPALGAAALGCWALLRALEIPVAAGAGHSYGEYVALAAAEVIDEPTLYRLSHGRGVAIVEAAQAGDLGTMAAVAAGPERVAELIGSIPGVTVANVNSPRQVVVSGTHADVEAALAAFKSAGLTSRALPVACGFHSPVVAPATRRVAEMLDHACFGRPTIPVFANTDAQVHPPDPAAIKERLAQHLASPVQFAGEVEAMYAQGIGTFVETGPRAVLTGLVDEVLGERPHLAVSIDGPGNGGVTSLQRALAALYARGVALNLDRLFAGRGSELLELDALEPEAEALPASTWLVSGGHARPAGAPTVPEATQARAPMPAEPAVTARAAEASSPVPPVSSPAPRGELAAGDPTAVLEQFERLMTGFLDTQRHVMDAYFAAAGGVPDAGVPSSDPPMSVVPEQPQQQGVPERDPAPAAPAAESSSASLRDAIGSVVSERTGYPIDALKDDVELESDLGIDSIKRVEIVAALRGAVLPDEDPSEEAMERLTGERTLGGLVAAVAEMIGPAAPPPSPSPSPSPSPIGPISAIEEAPSSEAPAAHEVSTTRPEVELARCVPVGVRLDEAACSEDIAGRVMLVVGGDDAVARQVESLATARGASVGLVGAEALLRDPRGALAPLRARLGPVNTLVHLAALATGDHDDWDQRLTRETRTLFEPLKALGEDLKRPGGIVVAATGLAAAPDRVGPEVASQAAVTGLVKALAKEWLETAMRVVHTDPAREPEVLAAQVIEELGSVRDGPIEVVRDGDGRSGFRMRPAPLDPTGAWLELDEEAVVLVTGGARGISALAACELARRWRPRIVLVGSSPWPDGEDPELAELTEERALKQALLARLEGASLAEVEAAYRRLLREREMRATVEAISRLGSQTRYVQADVSDPGAVGRFVAELYREFARLDVVIHGAGVIDDRRLEDKSWTSFERVLSTKAGAAVALARHLDPSSVRACVLFSSVAGRFGNAGQCDYAAANAVLDELAARLDRAWPGRTIAIDWGPWAAGMATPEVQRRFADAGIEVIVPHRGVGALIRELEHAPKGQPEVVVGAGPWMQWDPGPAKGLPLMQSTSSSRRNGRVEVTQVLDPTRDRFLIDHRLDGRPVLPAAVALEALAELAQQERPARAVSAIEHLRVLRGVVMDAERMDLTLMMEPEADANDSTGEHVRLAVLDPADRTQHYRATALLLDQLPPGPRHSPALADLESFPGSVSDAYTRWLFQGPTFQGITELSGINERGMLALLRPSAPAEIVSGAEGAWLFDPVLLDSGFQLVILWARVHLGRTPLPTEIRTARRYATPTTGAVQCELLVTPAAGGHMLETELTFTDGEGRVVMKIDGMQFACRRELNRLAIAGAG